MKKSGNILTFKKLFHTAKMTESIPKFEYKPDKLTLRKLIMRAITKTTAPTQATNEN